MTNEVKFIASPILQWTELDHMNSEECQKVHVDAEMLLPNDTICTYETTTDVCAVGLIN